MKNYSIEVNQIHPKDMKAKEWLEDFNSLYEIMERNNPYLWVKERMNGYNWLDLKDYYRMRISNARTVNDFLEIFDDAVKALQNRHTIILTTRHLDYYYREDESNFYQRDEPYKHIFTDEVREANEYWRPILEDIEKERYDPNFDALILYYNGDYRIYDGHGDWTGKYGERSKIVAVDSKPIDEAVKTCYEKDYLDSDLKQGKSFLWKIAPHHFGADAEFTIRTASGTEKTVTFQSGSEYSYDERYGAPRERIITKVWPEKKIGYLMINSFGSMYKDEDHETLMGFYREIEDYDHLIIDVRWNQGGSYEPWKKNVVAPLTKTKLTSRMYLAYRSGEYVNLFREKANLQKVIPKDGFDELPPEVLTDDFTIYDFSQTVKPSDEVDFSGKIVILIDKITFSATDAFALFCKETGFGKLYGTPTGGDGISFSPIFYVLPNSKFVVRFTPAMGIDYTGRANEEARVQPDVYYESEFGNLDELVNHVVEQLTSEKG